MGDEPRVAAMETSGLPMSWRPDDIGADWSLGSHAGASEVRDQPAAILADQPGPRVETGNEPNLETERASPSGAGGRADDAGAGWRRRHHGVQQNRRRRVPRPPSSPTSPDASEKRPRPAPALPGANGP